MKPAALGSAVALVLAGVLYFSLKPLEGKWLWRKLTTPSTGEITPFLGSIPLCEDCNVVLISLDTLRADRAVEMPNLQKIAQQSVVFTNAYANGYFTTPSHMTVFTSLYPARHRVETKVFGIRDFEGDLRQFRADEPQPLSSEYVTWAELMRRSGYDTFWNAPLKLRYLSFEYGFGRGFNHIAPPPFARGLPLGQFKAEGFRKEALQPLAKGGKSFVFLHSYITHGPYIVHEDLPHFQQMIVPYNENLLQYFRERIRKSPEVLLLQSYDQMPIPEEQKQAVEACTNYKDMSTCFRKYSTPDAFWHAVGQMQHRKARREVFDLGVDTGPAEWEMYKKAYTQAARELDRQIGEFWEELGRIGARERTIVVFFSDHGEQLLEHGEVGHGAFFQEIVRIPMMIYHPKLQQQIEIPQLASLVDLMPAVLSILGTPPPPQAQGRVPWKNPRQYVFGSTLGADYITDGRWKLISDNEKRESFYDLQFDPGEKSNLLPAWNPYLRRAYTRLSEARRLAALEISL